MNLNAVLSLEWSFVFLAIDILLLATLLIIVHNPVALLIGSMQLFHQGSIERNFRTIGRTLDFLRQLLESCCSMMINCQKILFEWNTKAYGIFCHLWDFNLVRIPMNGPKWLPLGKVFINIPSESVNEWRVPNIIFSPEEKEAFSWHSLHYAYVDWMFTTCKA